MRDELQEIWVTLAASPLLALTLTLLAYLGGLWLYRRSGENPLVNPVRHGRFRWARSPVPSPASTWASTPSPPRS